MDCKGCFDPTSQFDVKIHGNGRHIVINFLQFPIGANRCLNGRIRIGNIDAVKFHHTLYRIGNLVFRNCGESFGNAAPLYLERNNIIAAALFTRGRCNVRGCQFAGIALSAYIKIFFFSAAEE